jgi:hypothetical protein
VIVGDDEFLVDTEDIAAITRHIELAREAGPSKRDERTKKAAAFSWPRIGEMYRQFLGEIVASGGLGSHT